MKVGVSSGIYYAAREAELHNTMRKLGYTITRGTAAMEIAVDVAHEVTFTEGGQIRHIAKKQGVVLNLHGDLAVPLEIPERGEWRDAHDRITKSLRSAVFLGATYIDFHSSLNIWLELITYAGRKLSFAFCDPEGNFISKILYENKETREWFIREKGDQYLNDILDREENIQLSTRINVEQEKWRKEQTDYRIRRALEPLRERIGIMLRRQAVDALIARDPDLAILRRNPRLRAIIDDPRLSLQAGITLFEREKILAALERVQRAAGNVDDFIDEEVNSAILRGIPRKTGEPEIDRALEVAYDRLREETVTESSRLRDRIVDDFLREKLGSRDGKKRRWHSEELRSLLGIVDGYHIMAQYMYWAQDPLWTAMATEYKDTLKKYGYRTGDRDWLDDAWRKAETENDREYKEFFYAAVAAKYMEGHLKKGFEWLYGDFIKREIPSLTSDPEERAELTRIAKHLIIGIENPDAREPQHAGLYFLFRPKQIYAAIKTIRKTLETDKVMMIVDHEQLATQGIDALLESRKDIRTKPDYGKLTISCHSNHPNPLHAHYPIEIGDVILYELLYNLRVTGFGVGQIGFMIFERGGGQDPFAHSVDALRLMAKFLETDPPTPPRQAAT